MFQFVKDSKLFALHTALQEQHVKRNSRIIELNNDIYKKRPKKRQKEEENTEKIGIPGKLLIIFHRKY